MSELAALQVVLALLIGVGVATWVYIMTRRNGR